MLRTKEI